MADCEANSVIIWSLGVSRELQHMIFETQNSKKFFERNYSHELTIASVLYIIVSVFAECFGVFLTSFTSLFSFFFFYCWFKLEILHSSFSPSVFSSFSCSSFVQVNYFSICALNAIWLFYFLNLLLFICCSNQLFFYLCF